MDTKKILSQWLADGDLERTLQGLLLIQKQWQVKSMGNHEFDTFPTKPLQYPQK